MIVYLARAIQAFVMYCVNGTSRSSLLIESTDSMIFNIIIVTVCLWHISIIYLDVKAEEIWQLHLTPRIGQLRDFLKATFPENCLGMKLTSRSVQFRFTHPNTSIPLDVDLLVSPYWENEHEFYRFLRKVPHLERPR